MEDRPPTARSAMDCGSLLPLSSSQPCWRSPVPRHFRPQISQIAQQGTADVAGMRVGPRCVGAEASRVQRRGARGKAGALPARPTKVGNR